MRFAPLRRRRLGIDAELAERILAEAHQFAPLETGGVLLGDAGHGGVVPEITELVAAGPRARRERHRFTPDGPWQRRQIAERYEASRRTLDYLGDWHSHPAGDGPSELDRETARRIAAEPNARCPHPLFLIATRLDEGWELRGYRLGRRRFRRIAVRVTYPSRRAIG